MKLQTRQQPKGFLNSETSAQLLHGCSAADPRRRRSAYAAILWYTNRPYGHQMRNTKRLIMMLLFGLAGNEYPLLGDVVGRQIVNRRRSGTGRVRDPPCLGEQVAGASWQ